MKRKIFLIELLKLYVPWAGWSRTVCLAFSQYHCTEAEESELHFCCCRMADDGRQTTEDRSIDGGFGLGILRDFEGPSFAKASGRQESYDGQVGEQELKGQI